jgi:molybdate transport system ATP-binding protein
MSIECDCERRFSSGFQLSVSFVTRRLVTGVYGPSGSGKTTILNILAGVTRPDAGRVRLGERVMFDSQAKINAAPERRRVGYVFQDQLLFPHLSVAANLSYGQRRSAREAPERTAHFGRVVESLELNKLLDRYPRNLSGGERQRVALGRALISEPDFLLLDEPLAALHAELKQQALEHLAAVIAAWQIPTILVSHNAGELRRLCDWILSLGGGRLLAQGPPNAALPAPE